MKTVQKKNSGLQQPTAQQNRAIETRNIEDKIFMQKRAVKEFEPAPRVALAAERRAKASATRDANKTSEYKKRTIKP